MGTRASNWVDPSSSGGRGGDFSCEGRVSRFEILGRKRTRRGRCFRCPEEFPPGPVERILYEWLFLCHVSSPNGWRRKHPTKKRRTTCGTMSSQFLSTRLTAGRDEACAETRAEAHALSDAFLGDLSIRRISYIAYRPTP